MGDKMRADRIRAIASAASRGLVGTNPRVRGLAYKLRWSVGTLIKANALPSPIEQRLYLQVAIGYRLHPESLRKMLEVFRGEEGLTDADLFARTVGPGLFVNRFDEVVEKVEHALVLIDKTSDSSEYMMSMDSAAYLVEAYGEHAEEVLGQIVENLYDVARLLDIRSENPRVIVGVAVRYLVEQISGGLGGRTLPLTIDEMFEGGDTRRPRRLGNE